MFGAGQFLVGDPESSFEAVGLEVAKGDGKGVRGVGRLRKFLQAELSADHLLHLALVGMTVTGDAGLDFTRRVAADGEASLLGGEKDDTPDLGEAQGGTHVQSGKDGLNGHDLRLKLMDEAAEEFMDIAENRSGRGFLAFRSNFQCSVMENAAFAAQNFDDGVAGRPCSGRINTEDAEGARLAVGKSVQAHASKSKSKMRLVPRGCVTKCEKENGHDSNNEAWPLKENRTFQLEPTAA